MGDARDVFYEHDAHNALSYLSLFFEWNSACQDSRLQRFDTSKVPRQVLAPHRHAYSRLSFAVCRSSSTSP
jgi:hypothetical protein